MVKETIIIVEDEHIVANDIQRTLENLGYKVPAIVSTGEKALESVRKYQPDLVLMDIVIKGKLDGIETTKKIHEQWDIPVIYLTAYADYTTLERAKITDPFGYLLKPFMEKELQSTIIMALYKHQMSRKLKASEEKYRTLVENTHDVIYSMNSEGIVGYISPQIYKYGFKTEDWIGEKFIDFIHPDDRKMVEEAFQSLLDGGGERTILYRVPDHEKNIRWFEDRSREQYDEKQNPAGFTGVLRDVTDRKLAEIQLEKTTKELKLYVQELEQMNYIGSHDLQEPLRMVASYVQLLEKKYKDQLGEDASEYIAFAVQGVNRLQQIIQDFLSYSRVSMETYHFAWLNMNFLVETAIERLKPLIDSAHAKIKIHSLPEVVGDSRYLIQVVYHLIKNAIVFRSDKTPRIEIKASENRESWIFCVKDNGIGVEERYATRIFHIFQRLHNRTSYPGNGAGLAISKRIIEKHQGKIWLETRKKDGATFCFSLPKGELPDVQ